MRKFLKYANARETGFWFWFKHYLELEFTPIKQKGEYNLIAYALIHTSYHGYPYLSSEIVHKR